MEQTATIKLGNEIALIEAILFLESEPLDLRQLTKISRLSKETVELALDAIRERCSLEQSGLELVEVGGGISFSPKKELWDFLKDRYGKKNDDKLSKAAMETLSIIAYSQPITKAEIESIRGVSTGNMIRLLVQKGFIKEVGKKDIPGKPVQFGTTKEFLSTFKLKSISELPKLDELEKEKFELN